MIRRSVLFLSVIPMVGLLAAGCANDTPASGGPGLGEGEGEGAEIEGAPDEECPAGQTCANLTTVDPETVSFTIEWNVGTNQFRTVKLKYWRVDPNDRTKQVGIAGAQIEWKKESIASAPITQNAGPEQTKTTTDAQGFTTNKIFAGNGSTQFKLIVSAPAADPLVFNVNVRGKDEGDLTVTVKYANGAFKNSGFDDVRVRGYAYVNGQPLACDAIDPFNPPIGAEFILDIPLPVTENGSSAQWSFQKNQNGQKFTVVALGSKRYPGANPDNQDLVTVASACDSTSVELKGVETKPVTLTLTDEPFTYTGVYKATLFVDFLTMLPGSKEDGESIEYWITQVGEFFVSPSGVVLDILEPYILDAGLPANILETFGDTLTEIVDQIIWNLVPEWARNIFTVGGDIYEMLHNMKVTAEITLKKQPLPKDSEPGTLIFPNCPENEVNCDQKEKWTGLFFKWSLGACDAANGDRPAQCDVETPIDLSTIVASGASAIEGGFNATVKNNADLSIHKHGVQLNWGSIILGVVEKIVLPAAFEVRSIEEFVFFLLGGNSYGLNEVNDSEEDFCADPPCGDDYRCTTPPPERQLTVEESCCDSLAMKTVGADSSFRSAAKNICKSGVPLLVKLLKNYLTGQKLESGTNGTMLLGTSDQFVDELPEADRKSCPLSFSVRESKMRLMLMGGTTPDKYCTMAGGFQIGDLPIDVVKISFFAEYQRPVD